MPAIAELSIEDDLQQQVRAVSAAGGEVEIRGGGSKQFYGNAVDALPVEVVSRVVDLFLASHPSMPL